MKSVSHSFYTSSSWVKVEQAYKREHPICEECKKLGRYTPSKIIHHIVHLDSSNVNNPSIALNPENLMALCQECHNKIHAGTLGTPRRYEVLPNGEIKAIDIA